MSELKNGPFVAKIVDPAELDESKIDPLAYCTGKELGKFADGINLTTLESEGTIHGRPSRITLQGDEIKKARKLNYKQVNNNTGFHSLQPIEKTSESIKAKQLPKETVLVGRMRPYLNNTTVLDSDLYTDEIIISDSEWLVFEPDDGLIYYWKHIMRTKQILRQFSITHGQTRPRLQENDLKKVSVPDLPEEMKEKINEDQREMFHTLQKTERAITESASEMDEFLASKKPISSI